MGRIILVVLAMFLLALGCSGETSDRPSPTNTTAPETLEQPSPTDQPQPTITLESTVPLQTPQSSASPCPIDDESFCAFASSVKHALAAGDTAFILTRFTKDSTTCTENSIIALCSGEPDGTVIEGYIVVPDYKVMDPYMTAEELSSTLVAIARADEEVTDEYGDGTWMLYAVLAHDDKFISLVTTTIGPDPILDDSTSARRVFLLRASRERDGWMIGALQTIRSGEYLLRGYNRGGEIESWLPWGEE